MALADGSMKGVKTNAQHMAAVGLTVHEALGGFAFAALERVERDKVHKEEADKALSDWVFG
jgi:hypothetical protein